MVVKLDKISQRAAKKMDEIVKKHDVSASFSDELLCCAPFTVEDFHSTAGTLYQYTLRHRESGEAIAPLTSQQGMDMKLLLQCWDIAQAT